MSPRTVMVTGSSCGSSRAIAVRLARSGWRGCGGVRSDAAVKELAAESETVTAIELDVTVPEHLDELDRELFERLHAVLSKAVMHHELEVDPIGPSALTRAVLPELRRAQGPLVLPTRSLVAVVSPGIQLQPRRRAAR